MRKFEIYRMKDNKTPLSEDYFNPIWMDIDNRLDGLEGLKVSWQEAVSTVSQFGIIRIEEMIYPAYTHIISKKAEADEAVTEIQELRESADSIINANRDDAVAAVYTAKNEALSNIEQAKQQAIAQFDPKKFYAMTFFFGGE